MVRTSHFITLQALSFALVSAGAVGTAGDAFATEPTSQPTSVPTAGPTSMPTAGPTSMPTAGPTSMPTERAATPDVVPDVGLVQRLRAHVGDPYAAERISFTFAFKLAGARLGSRSYDWRPTEGTLTFTRGRRVVEFTGIDAVDPSDAVDHPRRNRDVWRSVAPDARPGQAASAWTAFINDRYWLLAPALATGPDANVEVHGSEIHVFFPSGGVTPGDRYRFVVDPLTGDVTQWSFALAGGRNGTFDWQDYAQFGPLRLSQYRISTDSPFEILFEDIVVE